MKRDPAHEATDRILAELEKKLRREYRQAVRETDAKLKDYMRRFEIKDQKWQQMVADGKRTAEQYKQWRIGQIAVGKRWETMRDTLAQDYHRANVIARSMVDGTRARIYAENFNFATYELEMGAKVSTGFTLYNADAVNRIIRENPELLPPPGKRMAASIAAGKDVAWQAGQIQSVMTQAILQGESIPHIAQRIAETMGDRNHASTIRYARTATTAAENAGREDAYRRAEDMGIDTMRMWEAVLDNRTRHEHRQLDGQQRPVGEPFEVDGEEILFPGDPSAPGHLIWNCRCRTRAVVKGLEPQARKYRQIEGDLTYEEWKAAKNSESHRITKQEEIAELMRRRYVQEDYGGSGYGSKKQKQAEPETPQFIPAKTKAEAEQFARQFAASVDYNGISLDNCNIINRTLMMLSGKYPIEKLDLITGTNKGRAVASASWKTLKINGKKLGAVLSDEAKTFRSQQEETRRTIDLIKKRYPNQVPRDVQHKIEKMEQSLQFTRWGVHDSYSDHLACVVTHEYGHVLSDQYFGMANQAKANPNYATNWQLRRMHDKWVQAYQKAHESGDIYSLSKYGGSNVHEFFAESFSAKVRGEKLPDYVDELLEEVLTNGIM